MSEMEIEYLNSLTRQRGEQRLKREWIAERAVRYGGWVAAGLLLMAQIAVSVM